MCCFHRLLPMNKELLRIITTLSTILYCVALLKLECFTHCRALVKLTNKSVPGFGIHSARTARIANTTI